MPIAIVLRALLFLLEPDESKAGEIPPPAIRPAVATTPRLPPDRAATSEWG